MKTRPDGWPTRLRDLVNGARSRPFEWGVHDCCLFALANFRAMTGREPANVEPWSSLLQAQRLLARHTVPEWADLWFGPAVAGYKSAGRGDIGLVDALRGTSDGETSEALAVILGANVCCPGRDGLEFLPLSAVSRTWSV